MLRGLKKGKNSELFVELVDNFVIEEVEKSVSILNDKQQQIINLYFGINGNEIKETYYIEKILGKNISMYVTKSLDKMKKSLLDDKKKREAITIAGLPRWS